MICGPVTPLLQHSIQLMPETTAPTKPTAASAPYTRANPFPARLAVNRRMSGPDSEKDTRHFEIDLRGWGLSFEVGDSMAVYPSNDPALVDEIINAIGAKGDEPVTAAKTQKPLREALSRDCSITQPTPKFLKEIAKRAAAAPLLQELLVPERKQDLDTYLWGMEVIDFLTGTSVRQIHPGRIRRLADQAATTALFRCLKFACVSRSSAFHYRCCPIRKPRSAARGCLLHFSGRASQQRSGSCLSQLSETFSSSGRFEHANDHDRPRHWSCAIPRVPSGPPGHWSKR